MSSDEGVRESCLFIFWRYGRAGEEREVCIESNAIEATPAVQRQSASAAPGIATAPRSVVQVPMTDGEPTVFREVSAPASGAVQVMIKSVYYHTKNLWSILVGK